jgi:hypothetical protein
MFWAQASSPSTPLATILPPRKAPETSEVSFPTWDWPGGHAILLDPFLPKLQPWPRTALHSGSAAGPEIWSWWLALHRTSSCRVYNCMTVIFPQVIPSGPRRAVTTLTARFYFYLFNSRDKTKASSRRDMCLKQRVQRKFVTPVPYALCECAVRKTSGAREPPYKVKQEGKEKRAQVETGQKH